MQTTTNIATTEHEGVHLQKIHEPTDLIRPHSTTMTIGDLGVMSEDRQPNHSQL